MNCLRNSFGLLVDIVQVPYPDNTISSHSQFNMTSHFFCGATIILHVLPMRFVVFSPSTFRHPPSFEVCVAKNSLLERRNMPHDANTTHIVNPTIGAPRFSETCFTVRSRLALQIKAPDSNQTESVPQQGFSHYYNVSPGGCFSDRNESRRSIGDSQPVRSHERAWRGPRTVANRINSSKLVAGLILKKRTKKMPEPTNT
jgi:hypothetical protein